MKREKQPGVGTREHINKQPGVGTQEPMKQEHGQQQARVHEATQCDKTAETNQREKGVGADVPEDVAVCMHGRTPKSQLSSNGIQRRKVQNTMVRISSQ